MIMKCKDWSPVTSAIHDFMQETRCDLNEKISPRQFNRGMCDKVAEYVYNRVPDVDVTTLVDELFPDVDPDKRDELDEEYPSHYVIKYQEKYFDTEVPCGVDSIEDIPLLKRFRRS